MMSFDEWLLLHKPKQEKNNEPQQNEDKKEEEEEDIENSNNNNNNNDYYYYSTAEEFAKRRTIYEENVSKWRRLNAIPGGATYGPDTESYADRTPHEFATIMGSCYREKQQEQAQVVGNNDNDNDNDRNQNRNQIQRQKNQRKLLRSKNPIATTSVEEESSVGDSRSIDGHKYVSDAFTVMDVDWRSHSPPPASSNNNNSNNNSNSNNISAAAAAAKISYVTPVKNQGPHGTCWSFAAAENLEGLAVRQGAALQAISEQEFISCCNDCRGRSADHTFAWLLEATHGVPALEES